MPVEPLKRFIPIVDKEGQPSQAMQLFSEELANLPPIIGTGSPESVYEAKAGRFYIDTTGGSGACLYVKVFDDISGERKDGWILT